jgi:hypothetical protein
MRKVTCMCEATFDADLPEEIDLDLSTGIWDEILAGKFLTVECPTCGTLLKPELRVRLVSKKLGMDLVALPELDRISLYRGAVELPKGATALVGFPELFERARIIVDGFDPDSIEIIKYWLIQKAVEQAPEAEIGASYAGLKQGKLSFHVSGLRDGEVAVLPIEPSTYERTLAGKAKSLREAPFDRMLSGPYKSVRSLETEPEE